MSAPLISWLSALIKWIIAIAIAAVGGLFVHFNDQQVALTLFSYEFYSLPLGIYLLGFCLLGLMAGLILSFWQVVSLKQRLRGRNQRIEKLEGQLGKLRAEGTEGVA